jgi:hypothetical protein
MTSAIKKTRPLAVAAIVAAFSGAIVSPFAAAQSGTSTADARLTAQWTLLEHNPLLSLRRSPAFLPPDLQARPVRIWNDPSVLREGPFYSMWVSLGSGPLGVSIYRLLSLDGARWAMDNGGRPVLSPGAPGRDPDWHGVETPAVIKVGDIYHMYYSFYKERYPLVSMAHATSRDGRNWQKQGELTSLTAVVGRPDGRRRRGPRVCAVVLMGDGTADSAGTSSALRDRRDTEEP